MLQIMQRDVSYIDRICPSHITGAISSGPLMSENGKMHGRAQMSQYEILNLFVFVSLLSDQETLFVFVSLLSDQETDD